MHVPIAEPRVPNAGIGPRPPDTIDRPFDVGALIEWEAALLWGIEGGLTLDEGSVDVEYPTQVTLEVIADDLSAGGVFTLRTSEAAGRVGMRSEWPHLSAHLTTFLDAAARLQARAAGPDTRDGSQRDETAVIFSEDTGGEYKKELAGLRLGVTRFDASIAGLGGCPYAESATGNLATEDLVWMLHGLGIETGVDLRQLVATSAWMAAQLGRPSPSRVVQALAAGATG